MLTKRIFCLGLSLIFSLLLGHFNPQAYAAPLSGQEILDALNAHQNKVKSIEADFTLTVFGVDGNNIEQSGIYTYAAPDKVKMEFTTPRPQVVKTEGGKSYISINNGPFTEVPGSDKTAGMGSDLFQYAFLKQFYLDIDTANKPSEGHLYKVIGYYKNEDGSIATTESVLNAKAVEFIFDRNRGLVTQMTFASGQTGNSPMPPIEIKQVYEEKSGCWVPKTVLSKVITPGGAIASVVKLANKQVESK